MDLILHPTTDSGISGPYADRYGAAMPVIALLELRLKPESLPGAHQLLREILADTRAFAGCEGVEVLVDNADPAHIVVHEIWASAEADAAYRAWRAGDGASNLGSILTGAPVLTVLTAYTDA
ncbi:quinol monooxygenase YgiN [Nakamurella sp. UYEF19]|uniref:putative quinol monooxygenase n=1 Tax=Nakamurella sp. UYEF19 TaxID=1756392 RepID=UPI003393F6A6